MSRSVLAPFCFAAVLVALLATSSFAETDVYVSGVIRGKYLHNTDEETDASASDARVELDIGVGSFTLGAVYRAYQLSDPEYNPAGVDVPASAIKHRYAALEHESLHMRAGHFVTTFGRGLTLRSYEEADLEHDTLLDGLLAEYKAGAIALTALTGVTEEADSSTRFYTHVVRGARASVPVAEWAEIAGSVVERSRTWEDDDGQLDSDYARFEDGLIGGELSVWAGPLTVAAEYADRSGGHPEIENDELRGHATYGAATLDLAWVTLLGEFKDYESFNHHMVNPPTCVREHLFTLMNRATYQPELEDERGFLVEASAPIGDRLYVTGGASEARSHDSDLRHWEMFGHASHSIGDVSMSVAASVSREYVFGAGGWTSKFTEHTIGAADVELPAGGDNTLELTVEGQMLEEPSGETYKDYIVSAAMYVGADLTVAASHEHTTSGLEERERWTIISVKKSLPGDLEVELGAGTERGGKKCTGGVCYFEPEFEGVRLRFTKFF